MLSIPQQTSRNTHDANSADAQMSTPTNQVTQFA